MPHIPVSCPSGDYHFFYSIATPGTPDASTIVDDLPVVVFIHSGYNAQEVFETQFADPELRRFNLVAIDVPGHGGTVGPVPDQLYTPTETAHDFKRVMEALQLPPVHLFGLSNGGNVALELACAYPESTLSLTVCSPLSPTEPQDLIEGRMQVARYWMESFKDGSKTPEARKRQEELLDETLLGAMQLLYNNEKSRLLVALARCAMVRAITIWSGSEANFRKGYISAIPWFIQRRAVPSSELAKIQCPVNIVHCSDDIGYSVENAQALCQDLKDAGVGRVDFHEAAGPHHGNVVSPESINPILRDTVFYVHQTDEHWVLAPGAEFSDGKMRTPWTDLLSRFGYDPSDNNEGMDEDEWSFTTWFDHSSVDVGKELSDPDSSSK